MSSTQGALLLPRPRVREATGRETHGMGVLQSLAAALEALTTNKMCSLLTMLGIIIGVGAVVIMVALGQGASASVAQRMQALGTNLLMVAPGSTAFGGVRAGAGTQSTLTEADAQAIGEQVAGLTGVSPVVGGSAQTVYANQNWSTQVQGVYSIYQTIENWQIAAGSALSDQDEESANTVAVVGQTVLLNLFGNGNPGSAEPAAAVGQTIRINKVPFDIVGVLASKGGANEDDVVLVPFRSAQLRLFNRTYVNQIVLQAADAKQMNNIQSEVTDLLRTRHRLTTDQNDFNIRNLNSIVQTAESVTQTLTLLLSAVAAVSLIVGGIGIMNIMLVSVTERTREIGIRMAIGARTRDILSQFLIEAIVLSAVGGLIGVAFGIGGSIVTSRIAQWNTVIAPESILLAFGFAAIVGIFFGFYPARKASQLDPIQALRYE